MLGAMWASIRGRVCPAPEPHVFTYVKGEVLMFADVVWAMWARHRCELRGF